MFQKILIANRGEIACRIIQTCKRLGIATVAVYSEADAQARHVRLADEGFCLGPAASKDSYLRADAVVAVAVKAGAQAIHPGYGFLSENDAFAQACADAGIVFIGPPVGAIQAMGSKAAAKRLMDAAGVPLVPGYHGDDQDAAKLAEEAGKIGFPVLIKAVSGGGGKGMRVVEAADEFAAALASCQREGKASFGDERVLIEKYVTQPRHVEIQIFGDASGQVIHLYERDCSAQRRYQKVVEEAPAPAMTAEWREQMGQAACDAGKAVGYVGAGTVEFIVDPNDKFYFMEMNTRLQVEHPVTEMITGLDLVEWQLRVADGESLPLAQQDIPLNGHAIEVRVYAEEPEKDFLPSIGRLTHFEPPSASRYVRVDTGVETGDEISPHYDPMLAKLVVWDVDRPRAVTRMLSALSQFRILGVGNNIAFLSRLIDHPDFRNGVVDTGLIARDSDMLLRPQKDLSTAILAAATVWMLRAEKARTKDPSPWAERDAWRMNSGQTRRLEFRHGDVSYTVDAHRENGAITLSMQGFEGPASWLDLSAGRGLLQLGEASLDVEILQAGATLQVYAGDAQARLEFVDPLEYAFTDAAAESGLTAPMPGTVIAHCVTPGKPVKKGDALLIMEAMKMEHSVNAPADGVVKEFLYQEGAQVGEGAELIDFKIAE